MTNDLQRYDPEPPVEGQGYNRDNVWQPPAPTRSPILRYLAALLRYRWLLLVATLLGGGGALLAWRLVRPNYSAQGSLWISKDLNNDNAGPISEGGLLQSYAWIDLLKSYAVLDPVVVGERLYLEYDPNDTKLFETFQVLADSPFRPGAYELVVGPDRSTYTLRTKDGLTLETGAAGSSIGVPLGFRWTPPAGEFTPDRTASFVVRSPRDAAVRLREGLETKMDPLGSFIQLALTNPDPQRASNVLEGVMQGTVTLARDVKRRKLDEVNRILGEQLQVVEADLRRSEEELETYRVQTITLPSDNAAITPGLQQTQAPVLNQYFNMQLELEQVRFDRAQMEEVLASKEGTALRISALEVIPAVRGSSQLVRNLQDLTEAETRLRVLRERYTEDYADVREMRSRVANLMEVAIPQAAQSVLNELRAREAVLTSMIASRSTELKDIPPRMIEEARLKRRVEITNQLYIDLQKRFETSSLASKSSVPDIQILDHPVVPTVPEGDQRIRWALMAFAGVLGSAVGLVLLLDRTDTRLRDPLDVMGEIGLPIIGAVPHLKPGTLGSQNQVREAFRELRVGVEYAHGSVRPLVLCVSSPAENEGKSFVSANLAMAFAGLGRRTLLLDADTRRGDAHELFGLQRKPGLTDCLLSDNGAEVPFQTSAHRHLSFLSSGSRDAGSPELLTSRRMQELFASAKKRFDVIIVDSPPLGAGADAYVLSAHAGSLVLVLRSGTTNKSLTMAKIEPLMRLPVRILGAVLNDFVPGRLYGSYQYYGDYTPGYEAENEPPMEIGGRTEADEKALTP